MTQERESIDVAHKEAEPREKEGVKIIGGDPTHDENPTKIIGGGPSKAPDDIAPDVGGVEIS